MFNYHKSPNCEYDLWAPMFHSTIENRAYSGFAYHSQEIENIINSAVEAYYRGEDEVDITGDCFLSEEDYDYIAAEVERRIN